MRCSTILIILLLYAHQSWAFSGDSTVVGPIFAFGNISTSNYKIRANRPTDRVVLVGANNAIVTASGKIVTIAAPTINNVAGFSNYSTGVTSRFGSKFLVQTADSRLPNAQAMGVLGTGIVKNTTSTGVQSIAVASDFPTLNQNTTGTASNVSGTPALPNGTSATTQSQGDGTTKLATDAYVDTGLGSKEPFHNFIAVDTSGGTVTETLSGGTASFVKSDASINKVHILPNGSNTIMGLMFYDLTNQYENVTLTLIGTIYYRR